MATLLRIDRKIGKRKTPPFPIDVPVYVQLPAWTNPRLGEIKQVDVGGAVRYRFFCGNTSWTIYIGHATITLATTGETWSCFELQD